MILLVTEPELKILGIPISVWHLVVPLVTFFLGYLLAIIINKINEKNRIKSINDYIYIWIDSIKRNTKKQSDKFENMCKKLNKLDDIDSIENEIVFTNAKKIKAIGEVDILKALVLSRKNSKNNKDLHKAYRELIVGIDFLIAFRKYFDNQHNLFQENLLEIRDNHNKYWEKLSEYSSFYLRKPDKYTDNLFLGDVKQIIYDWSKKKNYKSIKQKIKFINEIEKLIEEKYPSKSKYYDNITEILNIVLPLKEYLKDFIKIKEDYIESITYYKNEMNSHMKNIITSSLAINNYKFKSAIWIK